MNILENGKLKVIFFRAVMIFCAIMLFSIVKSSHLGFVGFLLTTVAALVGAMLIGLSDDKVASTFKFSLVFGMVLVVLDLIFSMFGYSLSYSQAFGYFFVNLIESIEVAILGLSFFYSLKELQPS